MSYEKATPHTDALDTLGSLITPAEKRDAIHLAVEPVMANEKLEPGDNVGIKHKTISGNSLAAKEYLPHVGIVDPFLKAPVYPGQWFWLVVYPRQIKSLRHVWEHEAFPPSELAMVKEVPAVSFQPSIEQIGGDLDLYLSSDVPLVPAWADTPSKQLACGFVIGKANTLGVLPSELLTHAKKFLVSGDYWMGEPTNQGSIAGLEYTEYGKFEGMQDEIDEDFWIAFEALTGIHVEDKDDSFLSCSC